MGDFTKLYKINHINQVQYKVHKNEQFKITYKYSFTKMGFEKKKGERRDPPPLVEKRKK